MGLFGNDMTEELQTKISEIENNITAIEGKISQLMSDVEASYSVIKTDIQKLKTNTLESLEIPEPVITSTVDESKINDLQQRLETIEKRLMIGGWAPK